MYRVVPEIGDEQLKAQVFDKLADLYEMRDDNIRMQLVLEEGLQLQPEDKQRRFRLAYSYGKEKETKPLAVYHYRILARYDLEYNFALNNLGAELINFDLKGEKIRLWKQASEFNQPYPAGNLAIALADAGFFDEARAYIEELPDEYRNKSRAVEALEYIKNAEERELERSEKLDKFAGLKHRYMLKAVAARNDKTIRLIPSNELRVIWKMNGDLQFQINEMPNNAVKGEMHTDTRLYDISGERKDVLLDLHFKQTKVKRPLGLLAPFTPSPSYTWSDVILLRDEYDVRLVLQGPRKMIGYRESSDLEITEVELHKVD